MSSVELFLKIAAKKAAEKNKSYILLDHIDKENDNYKEYYCANIEEKLFECDNKLIYVKGGGFGLNYRYCSACYNKWNNLKYTK
jgi:hypothetical protein